MQTIIVNVLVAVLFVLVTIYFWQCVTHKNLPHDRGPLWVPCQHCKRVWRNYGHGHIAYETPLVWEYRKENSHICPECIKKAKQMLEDIESGAR